MKKEFKKEVNLELIEGLVVKIQKNEANKLRGGFDDPTEGDSVNTQFTEIAGCCGQKGKLQPDQFRK